MRRLNKLSLNLYNKTKSSTKKEKSLNGKSIFLPELIEILIAKKNDNLDSSKNSSRSEKSLTSVSNSDYS